MQDQKETETAALKSAAEREQAAASSTSPPPGAPGRPLRPLFVVHAKADTWFVQGVLLPSLRLEEDQRRLSSELPLGELTLDALEEGITTSQVTAVVVSAAFVADGLSRYTEQLANHAAVEGGARVIPLLLDDVVAPLRVRAKVSLDLREQERWDDELAKLRALMGRPPAAPEKIECPYPGLRSLAREDAGRLFGRARELQDIMGRVLTGEREIYLIGPSGSGKSSLVSAGVLPRLAGGVGEVKGIVARQFRPGDAPVSRLCEAFQEDPSVTASGASLPKVSEEVPAASEPSLPKVSEEAPAASEPQAELAAELGAHVDRLLDGKPAGHRLVVHVDQMEEIFTLASEEERGRFFTGLEVLRADPRCLLFCCLRADFFDELIISPLWTERTCYLAIGPLRGEALREAIVRPALEVGVHLEPALAERLLADASGASGILPLVQETLLQLWELRHHRVLSLLSYERMGSEGRSGLAVAMSRRADACWRELSEAQRKIAQRILLRLIHFGESSADTRWQRPRAALEIEGEPRAEYEAVLDHLTKTRLITTDAKLARRNKREARVDLAHEALIEAWDRLAGLIKLRRADGQRHRQLENAAASWVARGRVEGGLLHDKELTDVLVWRHSEGARELGHSAELEEFLDASKRAQQQQRLRSRLIAGGLGSLFLLAVMLLSLWILRGQEIEEGRAELGQQRAQRALLMSSSVDQQVQRAEEQGRLALLEGRAQRALPFFSAARKLRKSDAPSAALRLMFHQASRVWMSDSAMQGSKVNAVAMSPDGALWATAGADGVARLWSTGAGGASPVASLPHDGGEVLSVAFSPDGRCLVTGGSDGSARIWSVNGGALASLRHQGTVRVVVFSADSKRIATASDDKTARVWEVVSGRPVTPPLAHGGAVQSVAFGHDGTLLATGSADHRARVWQVAEVPKLIASLPHRDAVTSVGLSADDARALTVTGDDGAQVWEVGTGKRAFMLSKSRVVDFAAYSPDGKWIITTGSDHSARLWDASSGNRRDSLLKHDAAINHAVFSSDSVRVLTISDDKTARLWDVITGTLLAAPLEHDREVLLAAIDGNGHHLITGGGGPRVRIWQVDVAAAEQRSFRHEKFVLAGLFTQDGNRVVTAGDDKMAILWDVTSGEKLKSFPQEGHDVTLAISADGRWLATGSSDGKVHIWDLATGMPRAISFLHVGGVRGLAFSPDGKWLATAGDDRTAQVWDIESGRRIHLLEPHSDEVTSVAFSPDGTLLATSCRDGALRVWRVVTEQSVLRVVAHPDGVESVQFSPDGKRLVTAGRDEKARVWNVSDGTRVFELEHYGGVEAARYSPDGRFLATAGHDKYARIWDAASGAELVRRRYPDDVRTVAWSPDGARLLVGGNDRVARLWDVALDGSSKDVWEVMAARAASSLLANQPYAAGTTALGIQTSP